MAKEDTKKASTEMVAPTSAQEDAALAVMTNWSEEDLLKGGFSREVIFKFEDEGEKCRGIYIGRGADVELTAQERDENGNVRTLPTWRVQNGGVTVRIIGTHELNQWFGGLPEGTEVAVVFKGEENLKGGHRVKRYACYAKQNGKMVAHTPPGGNARPATATA